MDPFSLTLGLITAFKEVYALSRCIYRACESARASDEEREHLRKILRFELLSVQSFGRRYLKKEIIIGDAGLDIHWASLICEVFEDLRKTLNDYRKLDDPFYKQWSPYANEKFYGTDTIELPLDETIPPAVIPGKKLTLGSIFFTRAKETAAAAGKSAKWALYDKKKLETTVRAFQTETEKLRGYLPLAQSAQLFRIEDKMGTLSETIRDHDANVLGLVKHAELLKLNEKDESDFNNANEMRDCNVKIESSDSELSSGTVEFVREGSCEADAESVMIELKHYPPTDDGAEGPDPDTEVNVRRLAALLKISASGTRELRTLPFKYYVHQPKEERYAFVFGYPLHAQQTQPQSLYELIKSSLQEKRFSLGTRFQVAKAIAQSIGSFHADGWVHKSVCSQSVVFFKDRTTKSLMLESPYLVDFGYSRPEEGRTYARSYQATNRSTLYLHPDRPRMTFTKLHDVYALGVVLLEIATWKVARDHFESAIGNLDRATAEINKEEVREKFESIARRSIPYHMGVAYMEAVVACLDDTFRGQTGTAEFVGDRKSVV